MRACASRFVSREIEVAGPERSPSLAAHASGRHAARAAEAREANQIPLPPTRTRCA